QGETPAVDNAVGPSGAMPQWPERGLAMPESDEYFVVSSDSLTRLADSRTSWALNGLLACIGLFGGTAINAFAAMTKWPLDIGGLLNTVTAAGSLVGGIVVAAIVIGRGKQFGGMMEKIRKGKRYRAEGAALVPQKPKENG